VDALFVQILVGVSLHQLMRLLYISFWSIDNGLTHATIFPVLRYLIKEKLVLSITLTTPESKHNDVSFHGIEGVTWLPIYTAKKNVNESGFWQIITLLRGVGKHLRNHKLKYDMLWARGAVAGGVASLLSKVFSLPFGVESFEPHSDYMLESGAWKDGQKYRIQKKQEARAMKNASILITVSSQYTEYLKSNGLTNVHTIPCSLDFDEMPFDSSIREEIRSSLPQVDNQWIVGIYVGKFGDIYYDDEFFDYIGRLLHSDENYFQIILTPMLDHAKRAFEKRGISAERFLIKKVPHSEIGAYLSAADIGFCPVRQTKSKKYMSPVKTGEYLAVGLPIIVTKDISDDSQLIEENEIGLVVDFEDENARTAIPDLRKLSSISERTQIQELGALYRDSKHNFKVYNQVFKALT
jgi:glycosyltransferase involved in cell wall biosynthesis